MFEYLKEFRCILVTGPQRSGTTICAHCIAQDTGHRYIDELDFGTRNVAGWKQLVTDERNVVIQCPSMARWIHEVSTDDVFIVWMVRPLNEIVASQVRVQWNSATEKAKYPAEHKPIAETKLEFWRNDQRNKIKHWREINYHDLEKHPLWVADRQEWEVRQWQLQS